MALMTDENIYYIQDLISYFIVNYDSYSSATINQI